MAEATAPTPRDALLRGGLRLRYRDTDRAARRDLPDLIAVISGGQVGADQAGLKAARALGLATGGFAPEGFVTIAGPNPRLGTDFGLIERGDSYAHRTASNVFASDATVRIAADFSTPGEACTLRAIRKYGRPHLDVDCDPGSLRGPGAPESVILLVAFLQAHRVRVLNVAGNAREDVGAFAEALLLRALGEDAA